LADKDIGFINSGLALDIGAYSIKMAQLNAGKLKAASERIPAGLSKEARLSFIAESVKRLFANNKFRKAPLSVSIPQGDCSIRTFTIPVMAKAEIPEAVKWAAKKYIAYAPEELVMSFSDAGEVTESGVKKIKIVFMAVLKEVFQGYMSSLQKAGFKPAYVLTGCFALKNLLEYCGYPTDKAQVVADIGYGGTNITLFKDRQVIFTRNVPEGTSSLEEMKGAAGAEVEYIGKLVKELELSFSHYGQISHGEEADKVILSGGGAQLNNLETVMAQKLGRPVEMIRRPSQYDLVESFNGYALVFGLTLEEGSNPNLVAASFAKAAKANFFVGQKTLFKIAVLFAALIIVRFGFTSGSYFYYQYRLGDVKAKLKQLESRKIELTSLTRKISRVEMRKKFYEAISSSEPDLGIILSRVSKLVDTKTVNINSVSFDSSIENQSQLTIRGQISSSGQENLSEILDAFVSDLDGAKLFKKITPSMQESAGLGSEKKTLTFTLSCLL